MSSTARPPNVSQVVVRRIQRQRARGDSFRKIAEDLILPVEAATLRVWVTETLSEASHPSLVLTGDLNDTVQAATTQLLLGPPGSEIGTPAFNEPDQGDAQRLWNLAPLMPLGKDYSRINQGRKELIDHILVAAALVKPLEAISVEAIIEQPLPSISQDPNARRDAPSSDHAPVVATFVNF